jgi:hypothetical protein
MGLFEDQEAYNTDRLADTGWEIQDFQQNLW